MSKAVQNISTVVMFAVLMTMFIGWFTGPALPPVNAQGSTIRTVIRESRYELLDVRGTCVLSNMSNGGMVVLPEGACR
jgi:hypothetical protein